MENSHLLSVRCTCWCYEAQKAGIAAVKPGEKFLAINKASHTVLAQGLIDMGIIKMSLEEAMDPAVGLHKRWTLHGVSHMLGMDVHDCAHARAEQYRDGVLEVGMCLTVEPGLYIQPDDELSCRVQRNWYPHRG